MPANIVIFARAGDAPLKKKSTHKRLQNTNQKSDGTGSMVITPFDAELNMHCLHNDFSSAVADPSESRDVF